APYGFTFATIIQAESARPFAVFTGQDLNGDGFTPDYARVDAQGNFLRFQKGDKVTGRPLGIDVGRGVPYIQADLRIAKQFNFTERVKLECYAEFFNLLNRANPGDNFNGFINATIRTGKDTPPRLPKNLADLQPNDLFGGGFGPGVTIGVPFEIALGFR